MRCGLGENENAQSSNCRPTSLAKPGWRSSVDVVDDKTTTTLFLASLKEGTSLKEGSLTPERDLTLLIWYLENMVAFASVTPEHSSQRPA